MKAIQTPVPGLRLYKNVVPEPLHKKFIRQLDKSHRELNVGHYDGFSFDDDAAFDAVFHPLMQDLFEKMKTLEVFKVPEDGKLKLGCTLVGYESNGFIRRHVDASQLSGDTVAVFSFNTPCVMNFYEEEPPNRHEKIYVPPRAMYVMGGDSRYLWSHAILPDENRYRGKKFKRGKRYSILLFEPGFAYHEELLEY